MEANTEMDLDLIQPLVRLQTVDRKRDRLQKKLDQVPVKLKKYTDALTAFETATAEQGALTKSARAEADRAELEVKTKEEEREKYKRQMNAPKLSNREYEVLQEALAGVLADINVHSDTALKAMERAGEAEEKSAELEKQAAELRAEYEKERERLEGQVAPTREQLEKLDAERAEILKDVAPEPLKIYENVRRKHNDALSVVEGTIDRAANRIGNDLHCSACYMTLTANDAVHVLARRRVVQCKSCVRILYAP